MAFALRKPIRVFESRASATCRVHSCIRCNSSVDTTEPCCFAPAVVQVCPRCASQEHAAAHVPVSHTPWGAGLARVPRR